MANLPAIDAGSAALSRRLVARIHAIIDQAGGWIGFDRYMAMALYEPGLGYYANGRPVFGQAGDFITAPELTPLFGETIARQLIAWAGELGVTPAAGASPPLTLLEVGAGSGVLASQLLNALARHGMEAVDYRILELSGDLRELQRSTIETRAPDLLGQVRWLDALPIGFRGIVIGNEVLDAMPVRLFQKAGDRFFEFGVVREGDGLAGGLREADAGLRAHLASLRAFGVEPDDWPDGYRSEICPQQAGWIASIADAIEQGLVLLLDYGFPAAEYYHPQRAGGTLMGHLRHRAHPDPFLLPGLSDITAHVDFSSLNRAARAHGLEPVGYLSQARFLLNAGLLEVIGELPRGAQRLWFPQAQAVQQLVSEAEMGELFKAIAFAKNLPDGLDWPGFGDGDRLHMLHPGENR